MELENALSGRTEIDKTLTSTEALPFIEKTMVETTVCVHCLRSDKGVTCS